MDLFENQPPPFFSFLDISIITREKSIGPTPPALNRHIHIKDQIHALLPNV